MKWVYPDISGDDVLEFSEQYHLSYLFTSILLNRDIRSKAALEKYFNKDLLSLYDPFDMLGMELAVDHLIEACKNKKKILVYGDYDVDGVTSASILYLFLKSMNEFVYYYIPEREKEGYGVSKDGIDHAVELNIDLIITCDCGITAHEEVNYAKMNGIEMIITDHHEQADTLPEALVVLDPKQKDETYPFRDLCGAGVVYKLLEAICMTLYGSTTKACEYLDLVAIGTAADIVPLVDENRCLVSQGLSRIRNQECRVGILELFNVCKMDSSDISVINIVFGLAPRLNAVGRMGSASRAITLLTTEDRRIARQYSLILHKENEERQRVERRVTEEALRQVNEKYGDTLPRAVVLAGDWHPGVIGIVSSKVKDQIHRPVFLIALKDGMGKGSGRSITDFDLYDALTQCSEYLEGYGGHQMAAGLTIREEHIPAFEKQFLAWANNHITETMLEPAIRVEADIDMENINDRLMEFLHAMEPFGPGNMRPKFSISNVTAHNTTLLKDKHLKFTIRGASGSLNCIGWNMLEKFELIMDSSQHVDMVFVPTINEWNGIRRIQLVIKDIRRHLS